MLRKLNAHTVHVMIQMCLLRIYQHIQIPRMITVIAMAASIVPDIILLVSIKYSGEAVRMFSSPISL